MDPQEQIKRYIADRQGQGASLETAIQELVTKGGWSVQEINKAMGQMPQGKTTPPVSQPATKKTSQSPAVKIASTPSLSGDRPSFQRRGEQEQKAPDINKKHPLRKLLVWIIVLAILGGGGYWVYQNYGTMIIEMVQVHVLGQEQEDLSGNLPEQNQSAQNAGIVFEAQIVEPTMSKQDLLNEFVGITALFDGEVEETANVCDSTFLPAVSMSSLQEYPTVDDLVCRSVGDDWMMQIPLVVSPIQYLCVDSTGILNEAQSESAPGVACQVAPQEESVESTDSSPEEVDNEEGNTSS
jgi:hypothetical protein